MQTFSVVATFIAIIGIIVGIRLVFKGANKKDNLNLSWKYVFLRNPLRGRSRKELLFDGTFLIMAGLLFLLLHFSS